MAWKKGQSGNPKGRKVAGESITEQIRVLSRLPSHQKGFTNAQAVANTVFKHAIAGESWACAMVLERLDGKVKDTLELQDTRPTINIRTNAAPPPDEKDQDVTCIQHAYEPVSDRDERPN